MRMLQMCPAWCRLYELGRGFPADGVSSNAFSTISRTQQDTDGLDGDEDVPQVLRCPIRISSLLVLR